jgi:hypothetical protein
MQTATVSASAPRTTRPLGLVLRDWHSNISAFIAPVVVCFALSGAIQIFDLHQSRDGYTAPAFFVAIGQIHKNQRLPGIHAPGGMKRAGAPGGPGGPGEPGGPPKDAPAPKPATLVLKWLFFIEALGLATTTVLGTWIGLTHAKRRRTMLGLLAAGTVLPIVLIGFTR